MMKRLLFLVLLITCVPVCLAGLADDPETIDGLLAEGEYGSSLSIEGSEQLTIIGGGANLIEVFDYSYLEIQYTSTPLSNSSGIYDILLDDYSELLYLDGITEEITLYGHSAAHLKGGRVDAITLYHLAPNYPCQVTIYCQAGYQMNQSGISGLWEDGSSFDIEFIDPSSFFDPTWKSINIEIIPEPTTLALLGLGSLLIRRKK